MIAHKLFIQIKETKDYYQRGQYLVVKQMEIFEAQQISIIEDEITFKAMKKIVKKKKNKSFIALEMNLKIQISTL